jgi:hypothetical protein
MSLIPPNAFCGNPPPIRVKELSISELDQSIQTIFQSTRQPIPNGHCSEKKRRYERSDHHPLGFLIDKDPNKRRKEDAEKDDDEERNSSKKGICNLDNLSGENAYDPIRKIWISARELDDHESPPPLKQRIKVKLNGVITPLLESEYQRWATENKRPHRYINRLLFATPLQIEQCHLSHIPLFSPQLPNEAPFYIDRVDQTIGFGGFAFRNIKKGEFIAEYTGVITPTYVGGIYTMAYGKFVHHQLDVDAAFFGNESRFINHSSDPNLEIVPTIGTDQYLHLYFRALTDIDLDEQLTIDYGPDYWKDRKPETI